MRLFVWLAVFCIAYPAVQGKDMVDVDGWLKKLKEGFDRDDESVVPDLNTRVQILADIFNAFDQKHKNLTHQEANMRGAAKEFRIRTRQFDEYKNLSLDYLERLFKKTYENYTKVHLRVQNRNEDFKSALEIANLILPYTTKLSNYGEKLNELYQDEKIKIYVEKYRNESYQMIGDKKSEYRVIENRMYGFLNTTAKLAGISRFQKLRNAKLAEHLYEQTRKLETADPKTYDVMLEQYYIGRALYATRKLLIIIIQCEAILEGKPDPFMRQHNTIDDQQSKEYFGVRP